MNDVPVVAVMRVPDGRVFTHRYTVEREYAENQLFWWTDGNGSCDCNRSLFIGRDHGVWLGDSPQEYDDSEGKFSLPCGDSIMLLRLTVDGTVEFEA